MRVQGLASTPWVSALRRAFTDDPVRHHGGLAWSEAHGLDPLRLPGPPGSPEDALRRAHRLAAEGELRLAMEDFQSAVRASPESAYGWLGLGASALALGALPQARQALQAYLRLAPHDPVGWANLAEVELRRDALPAAGAALKQASRDAAPPVIQRRIDALGRALERRLA